MNLGTESIISQNAARQYKITGTDKSRSAEKLSSGYRINRAADDAAGLSISEKMRKQIRGLDKASQNINDGLSYVQVADSALAEVQTMMHRLSELSIQAANDTNTAADRLAIDNEVQDLKREINRIFETTEFNTQKIWETDTDNKIQIGVEPVPAVTTPYSNQSQSFSISENNKWLVSSTNNYQISADENGIKVSWTGYDKKNYSTTTIPWPSDDLAGASLDFEIGKYLDTTTYPDLANSGINFHLKYDVSDVATKQDVIDSINGTNMYFSISAPTSAQLAINNSTKYQYSHSKTFTDASGHNKTISVRFSSTIYYTAQLAADRKFIFGQTDTDFIEPKVTDPSLSYPDNFKNPESNGTWNDAGSWKMDFTLGENAVHPNAQATNKGTFGGNGQSNATSYYGTSNEPNNPLDPNYPAGNRTYWWYRDSRGLHTTPSHSLSNNAGTPTDVENTLIHPDANNFGLNSTQNGGTICVNIPITGNYSLPINNYTDIGYLTMYLSVTPDTTLDEIKDLLSEVTAVDIYTSGLGSSTNYGTNVNTIMLDQPVYESQLNLRIQTSDVAYDHISINYRSLRLENLGLKNTNTLTHANADAAIDSTAKALAIVSEQRSLFGAYQNRLETAHANVENTGENVQSSESRLRDTNMAKEMVQYSKANILAQAGEAMMAQSNSRLNQVLTLLQETF